MEVLIKLVNSLVDLEKQLEDSYVKSDVAKFNQIKNFIIETQIKISQIIK